MRLGQPIPFCEPGRSSKADEMIVDGVPSDDEPVPKWIFVGAIKTQCSCACRGLKQGSRCPHRIFELGLVAGEHFYLGDLTHDRLLDGEV